MNQNISNYIKILKNNPEAFFKNNPSYLPLFERAKQIVEGKNEADIANVLNNFAKNSNVNLKMLLNLMKG